MIPAYVLQALNIAAKERDVKPYTFTQLAPTALGITPAQINATGGYPLVGKSTYNNQLIVIGFRFRINSAAVGTANLVLQTTEATPTVIATFANAALTSGAMLTPGTANVTLGAGFGAKLAQGTGIVLVSSATATGAFTVDMIPLEVTVR